MKGRGKEKGKLIGRDYCKKRETGLNLAMKVDLLLKYVTGKAKLNSLGNIIFPRSLIIYFSTYRIQIQRFCAVLLSFK